jgi:HEAT repeat protein
MTELALLGSQKWQERKKALESLSQLHEENLADEVLLLLRQQHQDLGTLNAALQMLQLLDAPVTPGLIRLLSDEDPETRAYAALGLGHVQDADHRHEVIAALLEKLRDPISVHDTNFRFNIIEALGRLKAEQAFEALVDIVREGSFFLTFAAVFSLGEIGDRRAQPYLLELIQDQMLDIAAVQALGKVGNPDAVAFITDWVSTPDNEPTAAVQALAAILRNHLENASSLEELHSRHLEMGNLLLSTIKPGVLEKLLATIPDNVNLIQPPGAYLYLSDLAYVLGIFLLPQVNETQENYLQEETSMVLAALMHLLKNSVSQRAAAEALAVSGRAALPWLRLTLTRSHGEMDEGADSQIKREAVRAIGKIGLAEAIPDLERAIHSDEIEVAMAAAESLGKIGGEESMHVLLSHLNHPSAAVRKAVCTALENLRFPGRTEKLRQLIESSDPWEKEAAIRLLSMENEISKTDSTIIPLILSAVADHHTSVRRAAIEALPYFEDPQIPSALIDAVQDQEPELRAAAARSLSRRPSHFSLPLLYETIKDPDPWVRLSACRSIAVFGHRESEQHILPLLNDPMPPLRAAAALALGQIGGGKSYSQLQILLADEEPEVQQAAEQALKQLKEGLV